MKMRRTLLTAGVFALLAMIYVPTPRERGLHSAGYRFVFSQGDTSIAFFQLLVNVAFAALLGAVLATIVARMSRRALYVAVGCIAVVALGIGVFAFSEASASRALSDEELAKEQLAEHHSDAAKSNWQNAARNWRLALRFDQATRVEKKLKEWEGRAFLDEIAGPAQGSPTQDWRSDPVVDLSGLPNQTPAQAPVASGQRAPTPFPSRSAEHGPWEDFAAHGQPAPKSEKHISTHPKAEEPNVFDQFDSSTAVPIPRARPVRSPSPR
jgi:hypothetical protein